MKVRISILDETNKVIRNSTISDKKQKHISETDQWNYVIRDMTDFELGNKIKNK